MRRVDPGTWYVVCTLSMCVISIMVAVGIDATFVNQHEEEENTQKTERWFANRLAMVTQEREALSKSLQETTAQLEARLVRLETKEKPQVGAVRAPDGHALPPAKSWSVFRKVSPPPEPETSPKTELFYYNRDLKLVPLPEDPNDAKY